MAFLTGVDLEGRVAEDAEETLALLDASHNPVRQRRRRRKLELEDGRSQNLALCDEEKLPDAKNLLKSALALEDNGDPLEELRRRIKRTRAKMASQHQVMDGFLRDVREIRQLDRSFSSGELASPSSPSGMPALTGGASHKALCSGVSGAELVPHGGPRPSSAGYSRGTALRSSAAAVKRLGVSRSQPALMAAGAATLHQVTPLKAPAIRAPPGQPGAEPVRALAGRRTTAAADGLGGGLACSDRRRKEVVKWTGKWSGGG